MKKIIAFTITFASFTLNSFAQIPNAGFETWNNMGSYNDPAQWGTMNSVTSPASVYTCLKGTPGNPGTAYLKLISKNVPGMGVVPGIAATGTLNLMNHTASGFAFASRPQNLTGSWQYMPATGDTALITVLLSSWNSSLNKRDTVAFLVKNLTGMAMSWANFSLPLTYKNGGNPDTCVIILAASKQTPLATSYLYIDNLAFAGSVAGVQKYESQESLLLYPNPACDRLTFETVESGHLLISDLSGKAIFTLTTHGGKESVDISSLAKGVYTAKFINGRAVQVQKFMKD